MTLTPLITAAEMYPALERLADSAREELLLSFRIFDPATKLRDARLREEGLDDWGDLLDRVTDRGVRLRLLLADFDPLFATPLHRLAWRSASDIADRAEGDVQVLCSPHGQVVGLFWRALFSPRIGKAMAKLKNDPPEQMTPVQRAILRTSPRLRPVSLHQKCAVADGTRAIVGGLDVNERRWDSPAHTVPAEKTWHDVALSAEGDIATTVRGHLAESWNRAIEDGAAALGAEATPLDTQTRLQGTRDLRLVRTVSRPRGGPFALGPKPHVTEHEEVLIQAFDAAERHIYLETQFVRHSPLVDALVAAAKRVADLQLVIVLPPEPERILLEGDTSWHARHAHALQTNALTRLAEAYRERLALISPAQTSAAPDDYARPLHGAAPIYVHAKVTLIDDALGMIGSANLNGRSMRWDTEASILFRDAALVRDLRLRLGEIWLGEGHTPEALARAETWTSVATQNQAEAPAARKSFALPYPLARSKRFSKFLPLLPTDMF